MGDEGWRMEKGRVSLTTADRNVNRISRYNVYSDHLFRKFGTKVYKLPVNLPGT